MLVMVVHFVAFRKKTIATSTPARKPLNKWLKLICSLIFLALILSFITLAGTGFYAAVCLDRPLTGYPLMLHCTAAPVFMITLALAAMISVHSFRFEKGDFSGLKRVGPGSKIFFWLAILAAPAVILSIILSMLPIFGTHGQEFLYHAHRYSTLIITTAGMLLIYLRITSVKAKYTVSD